MKANTYEKKSERENLIASLKKDVAVKNIGIAADSLSILSYRGMTEDGRRWFYKFSPEEMGKAGCISADVKNDRWNYEIYDQKEYDRILGSSREEQDAYTGVLFRTEDHIFAPDTSCLTKKYAHKDLFKIIGFFTGTIADEFRGMYIARRLIELDEQLLIYYRTDETEGNIIRVLGFFSEKELPGNRGRREKSLEKIDKKICQRLAETVGKDEAVRLMEEGLVRRMMVEPASLCVMILIGTRDGKKDFFLADPCLIDNAFHIGKDIPSVTISRELAREAGITSETIRRDGFLILGKTKEGRNVIIKPARRFFSAFCRILWREKKMCGDFCVLRDMIIARDLEEFSGTEFCITGEYLCSTEKVDVYTGVWIKKSFYETPDYAGAFLAVEKQMMEHGFVFSGWHRNDMDYMIDFEMMGKDGTPVKVAAGKYKGLTAGVEFQMSADFGSAYRLCGVFYSNGRAFYCGKSSYNKEDREYGAVFARNRGQDKQSFTKLVNGFFYGDEKGVEEDAVLSPWKYLLRQAGLDEEKNESIFETLAKEAPSDETIEVEEILRNDRERAHSRYAIAKKIGKKNIMGSGADFASPGWTKLDTVMFLVNASEDNTKMDINRRRMVMECLGNMIAN